MRDYEHKIHFYGVNFNCESLSVVLSKNICVRNLEKMKNMM